MRAACNPLVPRYAPKPAERVSRVKLAVVVSACVGEILLVDDDRAVRRALVRSLSPMGFHVREAEDRGSALALAFTHPGISFALVDLRLGAHSGLEVLRELKNHHPRIRCLLISGYLSTDTVVEAMKLGAVNCLPKPFSVQMLVAELASDGPRDELEELPVPSLAQIEWDYIHRVLSDCKGNVTMAAEKLGIHRQSLQRKLRRHAPLK